MALKAQLGTSSGSVSKKTHKSKAKSGSTVLSLPFFEDFSGLVRDTTRWIDSGGVWVNNTFAYQPPSLGAATFDGLDEQGIPYGFGTTASPPIGVKDHLVSCPIDLSPGGSNIYLSFFWQKMGKGELPDAQDLIRLLFKDSAGVFRSVWEQNGGEALIPKIRYDNKGNPVDTILISKEDTFYSFIQEFIPVNNPVYFHKNFQFMFETSGNYSGPFDVWNIDYIVLEDGINPNAFYPDEIAVSQQPGSFLKRYSAMPVNQYFANPALETADSISTTINDFSNPSTFDGPAYTVILEDTISKAVIDTLYQSALIPIPGDARNYAFPTAVPNDVLTVTKQALALKTTFIAKTGDKAGGTIQLPNVDLRVNDTISTVTLLDDYYAYDDGSAEYVATFSNGIGARVAIRYELNQPDTLTDIRFNLVQFGEDLTGKTFILYVWKYIGQPQDSALYTLSVPIRYPKRRDQFLSVSEILKFSDSTFAFKPIYLDGAFYIGWRQTTTLLPVGYDKNNDASAQIFFNSFPNDPHTWQNFEITTINGVTDTIKQVDRGSLLFRPVFGRSNVVVTGIEDDLASKVQIFPNPASQWLSLKGKTPNKIEILDLQGRMMISKTFQNQEEGQIEINVQSLPSGIYLLRAFYTKSGGQMQVLSKRLVIVH